MSVLHTPLQAGLAFLPMTIVNFERRHRHAQAHPVTVPSAREGFEDRAAIDLLIARSMSCRALSLGL
jgi:hypothetical protein